MSLAFCLIWPYIVLFRPVTQSGDHMSRCTSAWRAQHWLVPETLCMQEVTPTATQRMGPDVIPSPPLSCCPYSFDSNACSACAFSFNARVSSWSMTTRLPAHRCKSVPPVATLQHHSTSKWRDSPLVLLRSIVHVFGSISLALRFRSCVIPPA